MQVRELEPKLVWNHFENLNAVPRPSKKEERIIAYMKKFGESLGLNTTVDSCGNVVIKKPATPGMENRKTVVLQSHLDMVHQKNSDTDFDFDTQGIISFVDGEWVKAKGTTLGADNGMGVAAIMTILESNTIPHPALEALFTIDEETGMTGAFNLDKTILKGEILLNLDTEDDDEFSVGCAGGINTNTTYTCHLEDITVQAKAYKIAITGLKGGHSGMDIHLERGNANKIMNRLLFEGLSYGLQIAEIDGGSLRNAIPRESFAFIVVTNERYLDIFNQKKNEIKKELAVSDGGLNISIEPTELPTKVISVQDTLKITQCLQAVHNGVYKMSSSFQGLVETSSSLARVIIKDGVFKTQSLQRSSVESSKLDVAHTVGSVFSLMGCAVEYSGSYPGWSPNKDSDILKTMVLQYQKLFKQEPKVKACHAGLECGILGERYPGWDMISFGPTIRNPHSPDEKVHIASVQKFWTLLVETLSHIPDRN